MNTINLTKASQTASTDPEEQGREQQDMTKTEQTKTETRSEEIARVECESILKMVRAIDQQTAAEDWAKDQTEAELAALLTEAEIARNDDDLREQVVVSIVNGSLEPKGFEFDEDAALESILNAPLSVEVRSGWTTPGREMEAAEFCLYLWRTGGPAVRIVGDICRGEPSNPQVQHQDWGTRWKEFFPTEEQREALQTYVSQFYFGD
jgi:hypothetical protein